MSAHRLGRGFADLPIEEQIRALRERVLKQELMIKILLTAVERLGIDFVFPGDEDGPEDADRGMPAPDPGT